MFAHLCLCAMLSAVIATPTQTKSDLPVVDLGYVLQRATVFNHTAGFYNFSNIRYAQPPVGELRFQPPQSPKTEQTIHTGEDGHICYQAIPKWFASVPVVKPQLVAGNVNSTFVNQSLHATPFSPAQVPPPTPQESEDCLFLDVYVPEKTFNDRQTSHGSAAIVWIHGGGYTLGSKWTYDPAGLREQRTLQTGQDVIFVALNYRLGAFGWSGGPTLQSVGTANLGLLDQRFALDWVQKNIKSFGGDSMRVTVAGESRGAASILGLLTSYGGGHGQLPFQQIVVQSPAGDAYAPSVGEQNLQSFLKTANVASVQEAQTPSSEELRVANYIQISGSQWGAFTYNMIVNGTYVVDQTNRLLLDGKFHKDIHIMQGHNTQEGLIFVPPFTQTPTGYNAFLSTLFNTPNITQATHLYPPIFNTTSGYKDNIHRAAATIADYLFLASTTALTTASHNHSYNYIFAVPPSLHTSDLQYTFYTGPTVPHDPNSRAAVQLQRWIVSFAVEGRPAAKGTEAFGPYGEDGMVQVLDLGGGGREVDPVVKERVEFWLGRIYR